MSSALGYMDLITMAEANSQSKQRELERQQARAAKERKLDPKQVKLKVGVQKFLAKKEEEERKKKEIELLKKKQLMELRNQDRKATSRVRRMINMTKSANKSVIAEATNSLSEQCNAQAIANEAQPDEDDYGYTSTFAAEMYKKMLEKYKSDAKKAPPSTRSESVKIHSLKPSSNGKESGESHASHSQQVEPMLKEKPKKKAPPPPPAFSDLLRLAEEKSKEPIVLKQTKEVVDGPEHYEFGRPMTAKEKKKYLDELDLKRRAQAAFSSSHATKESLKPVSNNPPSKVQGLDRKPKDQPIPKVNKSMPPPKVEESRSQKCLEPIIPTKAKSLPPKVEVPRSHQKNQEPIPAKREINNNSMKPKKVIASTESSRHLKEKHTPVVDKVDYRRKPAHMAPPRPKDKPFKGRPVIESDEEYDSEMDDFIDDSDIPGGDISSVIGQIFGYNKRKYADENSDDECMESSVSQQMREEARSLRIGVLEDLEDMRMEEEEKRRKALMAKKKKLK